MNERMSDPIDQDAKRHHLQASPGQRLGERWNAGSWQLFLPQEPFLFGEMMSLGGDTSCLLALTDSKTDRPFALIHQIQTVADIELVLSEVK